MKAAGRTLSTAELVAEWGTARDPSSAREITWTTQDNSAHGNLVAFEMYPSGNAVITLDRDPMTEADERVRQLVKEVREAKTIKHARAAVLNLAEEWGVTL